MPPDPRRARLLREALDLPTADRDAFVAEACGDDADLLDSLRRLLALDAATGLPLDQSAEAHAIDLLADDSEPDPRLRAGVRIGAYRLVRELGKGGMGSVWLAERADGQFSQQVALKLIRIGMDSEHVQRQFRRERALLARLQHPNIAQLIDGGIDERGRPWFAMEYIDGISLGAWIETVQPDLHARLELFAKLCRAVAHAHRQLVVHRDLKPSNVLVQSDGEPRLLDFGIARLVENDDSERTATMQRFLTRDFAAPEQLRGEPGGTSTDVYALGLILFEILTGERYRRLHVEGEATLRPSATLDNVTRAPSATITRTRLRGDLDAIALRALAEDPARRYADARQLADDVQRHLDGKPIEARPDGFAYRAAKFVRRNRAAVIATVLGLAALLVASGVAFRQAVQKTTEAERARSALRQSEVVNQFMLSVFGTADPNSGKGVDTSAGALLAAGRERATTELAAEPGVAATVLHQIGQTYVSLGEDRLARATLAQALEFNERAQSPSLSIAAAAGGRLAYYAFQDGQAERALDELDAIVERLDAVADPDEDVVNALGKTHELRGSILYATGRKEASRAAGEAAVAAWRRVRDHYPAGFLFSEIGLADLNAALGYGESALEGAERVLADPLATSRDVPPALLAHARGVKARALQALGRHAEAEPMLRATIEEFSQQHGADAALTRYWRFRHAETLHALGRLDEAQAVADAVLALPSDGSAAYRRTRVEVLAAAIARDRNAADAPARIDAATLAACGESGNAELCAKAQSLSPGP